jgi:hypothetical protein
VLAIAGTYSPKFPETVRADFCDRYGIVHRLCRLDETTQIPCRRENGGKPYVEPDALKNV